MSTFSSLTKAALVALPVVFLGACAMDQPTAQTAAATDVGARQLAQQNAARIDRLEQEMGRRLETTESIYQRDLRK